MTAVNPAKFGLRVHEFEIRVRYQETDAQGVVHHANYLNYFEIGRIEMLRAGGACYRELEESGLMLVVSQANLEYFRPAFYDDLLVIRTEVVKARGARIKHQYQIKRGDEILAEGYTVVAAVTREGNVARLPDWLQMDARSKDS